MLRIICSALLVAASLFPAAAANGQDIAPEVVRRAKRASALVVLPSGRGFGSAVCIDAAAYFLTNEHVIRAAGDKPVTLVLNPGEEDERVVEAEIISATPSNCFGNR